MAIDVDQPRVVRKISEGHADPGGAENGCAPFNLCNGLDQLPDARLGCAAMVTDVGVAEEVAGFQLLLASEA